MTPDREPLMTVQDVAKLYGVTPNALYIAINRRKRYLPPVYKVGRAVRFKRAEVIAAIKPLQFTT